MSALARLWLDLALFCALVVAYNPAWTGLAVHEWLCVVAVVPLLFHVVVNWDQTLQILRRFAVIVRAAPKVDLIVDAALFVAVVTVTLSGLLISQAVAGALGVRILPSGLWMTVHAMSADATVALLLVHFALHWRWIVKAARKLSRAPRTARSPSGARRTADPVADLRRATRGLATASSSTGRAARDRSQRL